MAKNKLRKATIRDVAKVVGVHHSTVSRALGPDTRGKISSAVVRQVERAAEKLGYSRNIMAYSLRHNRSFTIGILIPDLMNPIFPPMIRGVQDVVETAGYTLMSANTDDDEEKEQQSLRSMQERAIEGIIISTAHRQDETVDACISKDIPFVLINRTVDRDDVNAVVIDEDFGVRCALDHLVALGHTRIAHIAGPHTTSTGYERRRAFEEYVRAKNLCDDLIEETHFFTIAEGHRALSNLYKRDGSFTAVLGGNDLIALGCMDAMRDLGLSVPGDVSVAGYNDMQFLDRMSPALTTVVIPKYAMGKLGAKMLLEVVDGKHVEPLVHRLRPKLAVRQSTAALSPRQPVI